MTKYEPPFLLSGMPLYQRLLTGSRIRVFIRLAIPGLALLLLAVLAGVGSIPVSYASGHSQNVGFAFQPNWSPLYMTVVPLALLILVRLSHDIRTSVDDLEEMGILVPSEEAVTGSFVWVFKLRLAQTARRVLLACAAMTAVFLVADTAELARGYYAFATSPDAATGCPYDFYELDWSVAFTADRCWSDVQVDPSFEPPGLLRNLAFVVPAYLAEGVILFVFLIWFMRLTQFFFFLSSSLRGADFKIMPFFDDPLRRLGLGPLGSIYNTFLTLILTLELYVAGHRIQQIAFVKGVSVLSYVQSLVAITSTPARWLDPSVHEFVTADAGTWIFLVAVVLPITLVCWFPLFRLRQYIGERKNALNKEYVIRRMRAAEEGDTEEAAELARHIRLLEASNIWPNGDGVAQRFIAAMIVVWLGAIFPIVFVSLALGIFGILELIRMAASVVKYVRAKMEEKSALAA